MSLPAKTWPYGTQRRAKLLKIEATRRGVHVLFLEDELGEGHVILVDKAPSAKAGDGGVLTFTQGGPTGGYWSFSNEA